VARLELKLPGWDGVVDALRRKTARALEEAAKQAAARAAEKAAIMRGIELLQKNEYFKQNSMPPTSEIIVCSPSYGHDDAECKRLFQQFSGLKQEWRARLIREADAAIDPKTCTEESRKRASDVRSAGRGQPPYVDTPNADACLALARERESAARAAEATKNREQTIALLEELGAPDQIERYNAGVLPEEEFERLAKTKLFAGIDVPLYSSLTDRDVTHVDYCDGRVKFKSEEYKDSLTAAQWASLKALRAAVPEGALVELREHSGYCVETGCDEVVTRLGARVTIEWAGDSYTREYALPE
jgi:hypothetical protein